MQISVTGKQLEIGDALRDHVGQRLIESVAKYFDHAIDSNVVVSREAHRYRADISVHAGRGILVQGHGQADNPYAAFDAAAERIAKRLRRYKRRLRDLHRNVRPESEADTLSAQQYVIAGAEEPESAAEEPEGEQPVVIAEMTTEIERLTVGEAVMKLDLANLVVMMFRNSAHGGLNVVYRRPDGNLGWIDPQGNPVTPKGNPVTKDPTA